MTEGSTVRKPAGIGNFRNVQIRGGKQPLGHGKPQTDQILLGRNPQLPGKKLIQVGSVNSHIPCHILDFNHISIIMLQIVQRLLQIGAGIFLGMSRIRRQKREESVKQGKMKIGIPRLGIQHIVYGKQAFPHGIPGGLCLTYLYGT